MNLNSTKYIERQIIISLITSTEYINQIIGIFNTEYIQAIEAKKISMWCVDYYQKYKKAPQKEIQSIYMSKINSLQKDEAELIELILNSLSEEADQNINIEYTIKETELYFKKRKLILHSEKIQYEIDKDNVHEAEKLFYEFNPVEQIQSNAVTPLNTVDQIKNAFLSFSKPLIDYGNTPLGTLLNELMVQSSLVGIMGQNKGGKSFLLQELAIKGASQGHKVIFFQAGDMTQAQMERRQAIYFARKSDLSKYCGTIYIPILDCVYNQNAECEFDYREGGADALYPFPGVSPDNLRCSFKCKAPVKQVELIKKFYKFNKHIPCYNCLRFNKKSNFLGTIWYKKREKVSPLTWKETYNMRNKFSKILKNIKLITYPNEGLSIQKIRTEINLLKKEEFIPKIIGIDYADILLPDKDTASLSPRDQVNKKWQRARRLSQEENVLVLMGTQSDTQGFDAPLLSKKNFNEDRRILDHMTGLIGLNMNPLEKKRGTMRYNSILSREGDDGDIVNVMHRFQTGRPVLGSFW